MNTFSDRHDDYVYDEMNRIDGSEQPVWEFTGLDYRHGVTKKAATLRYRLMTAEEAKSLVNHACIRDLDGNVRTVKINGRPKTWKRDAARVEVPVKYGLYTYWRECAQADGFMPQLIVLVD